MTWLTLSTAGEVRRHSGVPSADDLHRSVGGYFEAITIKVLGKNITMYLNEEGKFGNSRDNDIATELAQGMIAAWDYIVGDVVLTGPAGKSGEETSLPLDVAEYLLWEVAGKVVRIYINEDQTGRHWFGYLPGDPLVEAIEYVVRKNAEPYVVAEAAFEEFNIGMTRRAQSYRTAGNRSLSMGDVIKVGDEWLACIVVGWESIEKPEGLE